ncbi:MAG: hypothetical protein AB2693_32510, partial [Candidatus Thiodiazotropha sp.]
KDRQLGCSGINTIKSHIPLSKPIGKEAYIHKLTERHAQNEQLFLKQMVIQQLNNSVNIYFLLIFIFLLQNKTKQKADWSAI